MGILLVLLPCVACIFLFLAWRNEKKLRISESQFAEQRIRAAESNADSKVANAERQAKGEVLAAKEAAKEKMAKMQQQVNQKIREEREAIISNKEELQNHCEKDILIECMIAIETYAQRMSRIENRLSDVSIRIESLSKQVPKEQKNYFSFGVITDEEFYDIVSRVAKRIGRIREYTVSNALVRGTVISQKKLTTWGFEIDFNDDGELTGRYTLQSENEDSSLPQLFAKEIAKEVIYQINMKDQE